MVKGSGDCRVSFLPAFLPPLVIILLLWHSSLKTERKTILKTFFFKTQIRSLNEFSVRPTVFPFSLFCVIVIDLLVGSVKPL